MRIEIEQRIREALHAALVRTGRIPDVSVEEVRLETPRAGVHGDLATNAALVLASGAGVSPRALAEEIVARVELPADVVAGVEVAGPGFINLRLSETFLRAETERILADRDRYGWVEGGRGTRVQLEFVSANPTGPLNVVSARAAAVGDSLARILAWTGVEVETEFYVNDGGTQIDLFATSVRARFREMGDLPSTFPEDGYLGSWVDGIAASMWRLVGAIDDAGRGVRPLEPWLALLEAAPDAAPGGMGEEGAPEDPDARAAWLVDALARTARTRTGARALARWWLGEEGGEDVFLETGRPTPEAAVRALGERWAEGFPFDRFSVALMVAWQRASLHGFGVDYGADTRGSGEERGWFHESRLYDEGRVDETLQTLRGTPGAVYEQEGALWLATSRFGDDEDRVLVRGDGRPTYFLTDIAYHRDKRARGYDRVIDIWGPDHHGHVARMKAAMGVLGVEPDWLEVLIAQQVNVIREGRPVKMSKRGGELISLDDVVREAGRDTSRFFFLMRRISSHLDFDLDLARRTSEENPVYYVQYALARISSIFEFARQRGVESEGSFDLSRLTAPAETRLMSALVRFPGEVRAAARALEPHRLTVYLQELAQSFHKFYQEHRVVGDDEVLARARLGLVTATRIVLEAGMHLVGVRAPKERM